MLKKLLCIFLCFTFIYNALEAHSNWDQPKISQDPNRLGHIFKDDSGHFDSDTPENRAFIESATASRDNWVGASSHGADIYLKTMPDGTQAWAEVREGRLETEDEIFSLKNGCLIVVILKEGILQPPII
jgi:hypothetical protein